MYFGNLKRFESCCIHPSQEECNLLYMVTACHMSTLINICIVEYIGNIIRINVCLCKRRDNNSGE